MTLPVSAAFLDALVPLSALKPQSRENLLKKAEVVRYPQGSTLFSVGDDARNAYYLIEGTVTLIGANGKPVSRVDAGSAEAQHPLAPQSPRRVTARCETAARLLQLDAGLLDVFLTSDQSDGLVVDELDGGQASSDDWMTRLLQMRSFQIIPPANLHAMFMRLQPLAVTAGTVVVQQGDPGDYFYIIHSGLCRVTREAPNGKPIVLADFTAGACFGEEALISNEVRNATVTAVTDCQLMRLAKQDFRQLLNEPLSRKLPFEKAEAKVRAGEARWLDVRLPSEFANGALPGAVNVPLLFLRMRLNTLDIDTPWIVVCDSGRRSAVATFVLTQRGYHAEMLDGGLPAEALKQKKNGA